MAKGNRKKAEEYILKYIGKIVTGNENVQLYKNLFSRMSDKEFDELMQNIRDGKQRLAVIVPTGSNKIKCSINNNFAIAKELGVRFFQRLNIPATSEEEGYTTPVEYGILRLPIRRAAQLLSKKISVPDSHISRDSLTGQVSGKAAASKITNPEVQVLISLGMKDTILELMKVRGGDIGANTAMNKMLYETGSATQADANVSQTGVVSTRTLKTLFLGMHIRSTL